MKILLTNHALTSIGGTQLVVIEMAQALRRRGHQILIFSPRAGDVASVLSRDKFPVFTDPSEIFPRPDIIHGHHHMETMLALLHLPGVPCVYFCHGVIPWQECPPLHPRILRYVFLSSLSAQQAGVQHKLPEDRFHIIPNHINLSRFRDCKPRSVLKKAAVCNRNPTKPEIVEELRRACEKQEISVDVIWDWCHGNVENTEALFASYDLVFGSGRTAIEAMAAGCAACTLSPDKIGPLITPENFRERRDFNFSLAGWERETHADELGLQLNDFSAEALSRVHAMVLQECCIDREAALAEQLYEETIHEWHTNPGKEDEIPAFRQYLEKLRPLYDLFEAENDRVRAEITRLISEELPHVREGLRHTQEHLATMAPQRDFLLAENQKLSRQCKELKMKVEKWQRIASAAEARISFTRNVLNNSIVAQLFLKGLRRALTERPTIES